VPVLADLDRWRRQSHCCTGSTQLQPKQTTMINVADYIGEFLKSQGVTCVFQLSGGMIMYLIDALYRNGGIEMINVHHEQSAAFAADAVGRLSGRAGVALATSGPGAVNLLTGVGSCYFDSSPAVFLTGQVNRHEQKGARTIRQLGFQETDIVAMAKPITKLALAVTSAQDIPSILSMAFRLSVQGRPGPVLIDIPMDLTRSPIGLQSVAVMGNQAGEKHGALDAAAVARVYEGIRASPRPMFLAGAGVRASGATDLLRMLARKMKIPVVFSLLACDCMPIGDRYRVGMIGTYGNRWANLAVAEADPLVVVGSRLDIRQTGADTPSFAAGRSIYHVNVEAADINSRVMGCEAVVMDAKDFLQTMLTMAADDEFEERSDWMGRILEWRRKWPDTEELKEINGLNPNRFMHQLSSNRNAAVYAVDVGLHQMWAAQSLELHEDQRFITSGGMGAMGFALPAAVGASAFYRHQRAIVVIAGDAGFQLNIQELQVVKRHRMPIKIVVMNNRCHGMTRQFQDTYFQGRYPGTCWGYDAPDFTKVALAYGIEASAASNDQEALKGLQEMWKDEATPYLLEVKIDPATNAYPKIAFGRPIGEMEPFAKPMQMEGT
jgi:acetolactate synthase-1/2/3 large subunit